MKQKSGRDVTDANEGPADVMAELARLPVVDPSDAALATRNQRDARAAYVRSFEGEPILARVFGNGGLRGAAVPLALLGVVVVYMHWAATAAMKLMQ